MPETDEAAQKKEKVLKFLRAQPEGFRCAVKADITLGRDALIREAETAADSGGIIIGLLDGFDPIRNNFPNVLGKRQICLVCGIIALITKQGNYEEGDEKSGRLYCCGQKMALVEPKPLLSAD